MKALEIVIPVHNEHRILEHARHHAPAPCRAREREAPGRARANRAVAREPPVLAGAVTR
jgi:hypothetical protein